MKSNFCRVKPNRAWRIFSGQNIEKNLNEEPVIIRKYLGNGDISNTSNTPGKRNEEMIAQVNELSKQLNQARLNWNTHLIKELENKINALVGSKEVSPDLGPQAIPLVDSIMGSARRSPTSRWPWT